VSISSTFYARLFHQLRQKIAKPNANREKLLNLILYEKPEHKMLMKLTPGIIQIIRDNLGGSKVMAESPNETLGREGINQRMKNVTSNGGSRVCDIISQGSRGSKISQKTVKYYLKGPLHRAELLVLLSAIQIPRRDNFWHSSDTPHLIISCDILLSKVTVKII
jgi:hypothetical protein